ncbi:MAG: hypothetical protein PHF86_08760 [Candidatus Nanoarchaeia archaeon]|nr:hypothetical protein [Candidatus Nanoarchaeia archaeon]
MEINPKKLQYLESFTKDDFANWISYGCINVNNPDFEKRRSTFEPFHTLITSPVDRSNYPDCSGKLKQIYDNLTDNSKNNFNKGIIKICSTLNELENPNGILIELTDLIRVIKIPEALPELIKQIENDQLKDVDSFARILSVTCEMGINKGKDYTQILDLIKRLKNNSHFRYGFSPITFLGLCSADPDNFYKHLDELRTNFTLMNKELGTDEAYITGAEFIHYVGIERFLSDFEKLKLTSPDDKNILNYDNWLVQAIFDSTGGIENAKFDKDNLTISHKENKYNVPETIAKKLEEILA